MQVLTVYRPTKADREFFQWSVDGELLAIPGICPWHECTTMLMVRDLDVREEDVIAACRNSFENSGHDDQTFGEPLESIVQEIASDAIEAASEHPVGTVLRLTQGRGREWQYRLEPAETCTR
ncbi:hypothetical protein MMAN_58110 [Mycobacterium mantenii]|uniref:DUF7715 domain-containing protein n=1 Tax=Mycobacterium mantenii TaxID=560555 RepID=A0A1X0G3X3_MYCNT|nr:hypothetical protein [Mycobacterium mantenii]MCV7243833.1 hypothetical protein [Mycobacterium mantenii]ORB08717.1 hypothetical protein BST30_01900 [Mycobacterium mantenii]BBY35895.1 hypothetical protein MMAN_00290 [Mycobacterium mantenii]BBY41677.1 hypothetical protein MMAN_58110 [Mycobacterium mantenii]